MNSSTVAHFLSHQNYFRTDPEDDITMCARASLDRASRRLSPRSDTFGFVRPRSVTFGATSAVYDSCRVLTMWRPLRDDKVPRIAPVLLLMHDHLHHVDNDELATHWSQSADRMPIDHHFVLCSPSSRPADGHCPIVSTTVWNELRWPTAMFGFNITIQKPRDFLIIKLDHKQELKNRPIETKRAKIKIVRLTEQLPMSFMNLHK